MACILSRRLSVLNSMLESQLGPGIGQQCMEIGRSPSSAGDVTVDLDANLSTHEKWLPCSARKAAYQSITVKHLARVGKVEKFEIWFIITSISRSTPFSLSITHSTQAQAVYVKNYKLDFCSVRFKSGFKSHKKGDRFKYITRRNLEFFYFKPFLGQRQQQQQLQ